MPCLRFRHGFPQIADCFIHCPVEARFHVLYSFFHVDVRRNAHVIVAGSVQHEAFHGADAERPSARKLCVKQAAIVTRRFLTPKTLSVGTLSVGTLSTGYLNRVRSYALRAFIGSCCIV